MSIPFLSPSKPAAPAPLPTPPAQDPAQVQQQAQAAERERLARSTGGRASTILTSPLGDNGSPSNYAVKTLLGM